MSLVKLSIGDVAKNHELTTHALRYYEKIGLLAPIAKDSGGRRRYSQADIERLRFVKRAQRMHFSLKEIRLLIDLQRAPQIEKPQAQKLVSEKLGEIEDSLKDLKRLKKDLSKMLNACRVSGNNEDCPIIEGIKDPK